jgi:hypothetical protein
MKKAIDDFVVGGSTTPVVPPPGFPIVRSPHSVAYGCTHLNDDRLIFLILNAWTVESLKQWLEPFGDFDVPANRVKGYNNVVAMIDLCHSDVQLYKGTPAAQHWISGYLVQSEFERSFTDVKDMIIDIKSSDPTEKAFAKRVSHSVIIRFGKT